MAGEITGLNVKIGANSKKANYVIGQIRLPNRTKSQAKLTGEVIIWSSGHLFILINIHIKPEKKQIKT